MVSRLTFYAMASLRLFLLSVTLIVGMFVCHTMAYGQELSGFNRSDTLARPVRVKMPGASNWFSAYEGWHLGAECMVGLAHYYFPESHVSYDEIPPGQIFFSGTVQGSYGVVPSWLPDNRVVQFCIGLQYATASGRQGRVGPSWVGIPIDFRGMWGRKGGFLLFSGLALRFGLGAPAQDFDFDLNVGMGFFIERVQVAYRLTAYLPSLTLVHGLSVAVIF